MRGFGKRHVRTAYCAYPGRYASSQVMDLDEPSGQSCDLYGGAVGVESLTALTHVPLLLILLVLRKWL